MPINFKKIAQRETVISEIMEGRKKVDKKDGEIHISEFDIVANTNGEAYAVCAISENEFINGGTILSRVFTAIVDEFEGDIERAREEFKEAGGINVRLTKAKTKSGRDITKVEVI